MLTYEQLRKALIDASERCDSVDPDELLHACLRAVAEAAVKAEREGQEPVGRVQLRAEIEEVAFELGDTDDAGTGYSFTMEQFSDFVDRIALLYTTPPAATVPEKSELDRYDIGHINCFGGGDVEWWLDYIRCELDRAHDFYQSQVK